MHFYIPQSMSISDPPLEDDKGLLSGFVEVGAGTHELPSRSC